MKIRMREVIYVHSSTKNLVQLNIFEGFDIDFTFDNLFCYMIL